MASNKKDHNIFSTHIFRYGTIFLIVLILFFVFKYNMPLHGKKTKEEVVNTYINALQSSKKKAILLLIPKTHNAEKAVQEKLQKLGGNSFQNIEIIYLSEFGHFMAKVTIQGNYMTAKNKNKEFSDEIYIKKIKTRWYLMLGKTKNGIPNSFYKTKLGVDPVEKNTKYPK